MNSAAFCGDPPPTNSETCTSTVAETTRDDSTGLYPYSTQITYICHDQLKFYDGQQSMSVFCTGEEVWSEANVECSGNPLVVEFVST